LEASPRSLLAVNNLRDARTDARCGKNTLCVLLGERFGRWEITFLLAAPFTAPAVLGVGGREEA
jgi:1,4-dihydroxy-2-naphthoate octaprenyltransferase